MFKSQKKSVCIVSKTEPRILKNFLKPAIELFKENQWLEGNLSNAYKIFFGEYFKFPTNKNVKFLGIKLNLNFKITGVILILIIYQWKIMRKY